MKVGQWSRFGSERHSRTLDRIVWVLVIFMFLGCDRSRSIETNVQAALTASNAMRTDAFDSLDSASFCDTRRFEIVEGTSGIIYSHSPYFPVTVYRPGRDCFMTIKAPMGYRVELTALEFQVGERFAAQSRKCAGDSLHIFDQDKPDPSPKKTRSQPGEYQDEKSLSAILSSNTSVASPIKANLCGRIKNHTIIARSTMNIMTLWWHSEPASTSPSSVIDRQSSTIAKRGFKLQWTAFRESAPAGCDEEREFACVNQNMCIPVELACDNVAHCNDKSDLLPDRQRSAGCEGIESDYSSSTPAFTIGSLAGICIGALLLLVLALVLISVCRRRQRQNRRQQHKYNQAPVVPSADKQFNTDHHHQPRNGTVTTSGLAPTSNSSNSSNSDNSRCPSSSTDSRNGIHPQAPSFAHPYSAQPQQQANSHLYHQIDSSAVGAANGTYYQPYYMADNGVPYQTKLLYHHHHNHHHHPQPPLAPPPSMVNGHTNYPNPKHQQPYYYQQPQQAAAEARQPMIA